MTSPWQILGVDRGADARTIRSAYARKLKTTRPDDDAEGYQRLREAYDCLLEAAREGARRSLADADADGDAVVTDAPGGDVAGASAVAPDGQGVQHAGADTGSTGRTDGDDEPALRWLDAGELAHSVYGYWQENGDGALLDAWPALHARLDGLPLSERVSASGWFAEFVMQAPQAPTAFVLNLADYFEWGRDYRADAVLGPERSAAIAQRLAGLRREPVSAEPAPLVAPLSRLVELMRSPGRWFVLIVLTLLHPGMKRALDENRLPMIYLYGRMSEDEGKSLSRLFGIAFALRCLLVGGLIGLAAHLDETKVSADTMGLVGVAACLLALMAELGRRAIRAQSDWLARRMPSPLGRLAPYRELIAIGVAAALAVAMWQLGPLPHPVAGMDGRDLTQAAIMIAGVWIGLLLAWPGKDVEDGLVLRILFVLSAAIGFAQFDGAGAATGIALALCWVNAALYLMAHHRERVVNVYSCSFARKWPTGFRAALVWILLLLGLVLWNFVLAIVFFVFVMLVPFNYLLMERAYSRQFATAALLAGIAWSSALFDLAEMPVVGTTAALALSLSALLGGQRIGDRLAVRMMKMFRVEA
jgi:hypothetical protein